MKNCPQHWLSVQFVGVNPPPVQCSNTGLEMRNKMCCAGLLQCLKNLLICFRSRISATELAGRQDRGYRIALSSFRQWSPRQKQQYAFQAFPRLLIRARLAFWAKNFLCGCVSLAFIFTQQFVKSTASKSLITLSWFIHECLLAQFVHVASLERLQSYLARVQGDPSRWPKPPVDFKGMYF